MTLCKKENYRDENRSKVKNRQHDECGGMMELFCVLIVIITQFYAYIKNIDLYTKKNETYCT